VGGDTTKGACLVKTQYFLVNEINPGKYPRFPGAGRNTRGLVNFRISGKPSEFW
jgi:hypothetical protein